MLVLAAALAYAGWTGTRRFEVAQHDLRDEGLPDANVWRVVQLSDLHLREFGRYEGDIVRRVRALSPDVIVLTGDAIDRADAGPQLLKFIRALGDAPVLLVPGNWEHWSGVDLEGLQQSLAITPQARLLLNDQWSLNRGDRTLQIIGLDDFTAGRPDLGLLQGTHESAVGDRIDTVLVQHSPGFFDQADVAQQLAKRQFFLCLSGHTHGGQIALGSWAPVRPVGSGRFVAGFYQTPNCPLYVSRGLGTSILPIRLGSRPEIAVFEW